MRRTSRLLVHALLCFSVATGLAACSSGGGGERAWSFSGSHYWTGVNDVKAVGNLAFASAMNGLLVVDVTDVLNPIEFSRLYLQGGDGLVVRESVVYVACRALGIAAVDVANPRDPRLVARLVEGLGSARSLALKGTTLVVGDDQEGVVTVDVTSPTAMRVLGRVRPSNPDRIHNLFVQDDRVYAGAGTAGVLVVDVEDQASPTILSQTSLGGVVRAAVPAGDFLIAAVESGRLVTLDARDEQSPEVVNDIPTRRASMALALQGPVLYLLGGTGITTFDVSNPAEPVAIARTDPGGDEVRGAFQGGMLNVASGRTGYQIFNAEDLASAPVLRGWLRTNGLVSAVTDDAPYLYIASPDNGILVDVLEKGGSSSFSSAPVTGNPVKIEVLGSRLVVFLEGGTVLVYDKSDPSQLGVSGRYLAASNVLSGTVQSNRMLLGTEARAVEVVGLDIPDSPSFLYRVFVNDLSRGGAYLKGNHLIASDSTGGFFVFDVGDPGNPIQAAHVQGNSSTSAMALQGNRLWVATTGEGLKLFDVSKPATPAQIGAVGVEVVGSVFAMEYEDGLILVGSEENGLMVLAPEGQGARLLYQYRTPDRPGSFAVAGNTLFVADLSSLHAFVWR